MTKRFQRKIEDFVCNKCGFLVKGSGYTDHCPHCLWSRHEDVNPGDRLSNCHAMMEPIALEIVGDKYIIHYKCQGCFHTFKVKVDENDSMDEIIKLSSKNH